MIIASKPERADVCIIGAGATGATAAKVLTEAGRHVVALEKGPWRTRETFGGDDLAKVELFCPVPQMVGGGTVHWQGWLPRFTPEDFRLRSIAGDVPGTTLADWPISYDELEPYYDKIEWAFGVS